VTAKPIAARACRNAAACPLGSQDPRPPSFRSPSLPRVRAPRRGPCGTTRRGPSTRTVCHSSFDSRSGWTCPHRRLLRRPGKRVGSYDIALRAIPALSPRIMPSSLSTKELLRAVLHARTCHLRGMIRLRGFAGSTAGAKRRRMMLPVPRRRREFVDRARSWPTLYASRRRPKEKAGAREDMIDARKGVIPRASPLHSALPSSLDSRGRQES